MKNLLVTGSNGQLGRDLINYFADKQAVSGFDIDRADITDINSLRKIFKEIKLKVASTNK